MGLHASDSARGCCVRPALCLRPFRRSRAPVRSTALPRRSGFAVSAWLDRRPPARTGRRRAPRRERAGVHRATPATVASDACTSEIWSSTSTTPRRPTTSVTALRCASADPTTPCRVAFVFLSKMSRFTPHPRLTLVGNVHWQIENPQVCGRDVQRHSSWWTRPGCRNGPGMSVASGRKAHVSARREARWAPRTGLSRRSWSDGA